MCEDYFDDCGKPDLHLERYLSIADIVDQGAPTDKQTDGQKGTQDLIAGQLCPIS